MPKKQIDISKKKSPHTLKIKMWRILWSCVYNILFRYSPNPFHKYRIFILRIFGAKVSIKARISPQAIITMPWNLEMDDYATLGPYAIVYSTAPVKIGKQATVSQYACLCTATHDYEDANFTLYAEPITIENNAWVAADVFVGQGVTIGEGCVIGARSSIYKNSPAWTICVGNPAKPIKERKIIKDKSNEKNRLPNQ
ncbi:MAG: putative colanic acid biosynthesis acetyltransferase [Candidatus Symbiothrix sp.]|nr:putative colanic acid biosynthesis acetyltransferase [Candidatus Symbiothrix sp.]